MKQIINIFLFCLILTNYLIAQPEKDIAEYKEKYPNEYLIELNNNNTVVIDIVKDSLSIYTNKVYERFYIDDLATKNREDNITYSSFTEISDIQAYTLVPKGKDYKKVKVQNFTTKDVLGGSVFHDDRKDIIFEYPELREGCKTYLGYRKIFKLPYLIGSFFFGNYVPLENASLEIKVHKDVEIGYKLYNTDTVIPDYTIREEKTYNIHRWEVKDIQKFESEDGSPGIGHFFPHIVFYVKKYKVGNETKYVTESLEHLHSWYYSILTSMDNPEDKELKSIVDSLVTDIDSEEEKVKTIFYWVQDNIKYIAFEDGMNGFVPEDASKVFHNKFGDCKGKTSIIVEMLRYAGIKCYYTWIGSRSLPYKYSELPSVYVDDHMIAAYKQGDEFIFLDGTGEALPYKMPTTFIQDKEALISMGENEFVVETLPVVSSEKNHIVDTVVLKINESQVVEGEGKVTFEGYYKSRYTRRMIDLSEKDTKKRIQNYLQKGNNKFELLDYEIINLGERDKPLIIKYTFLLRDYLQKNGEEYYFNMNLEKHFAESKIKEERKVPLEHQFYSATSLHTKLILPENFTIDYLPESNSFTHDLFKYNIEYGKKDNAIVCDHFYETTFLILYHKNFEDWNNMIKKLKRTYNDSVLIKSN